MTLNELAEVLHRVASDLTDTSAKWDANDKHVEQMNREIASLTTELKRHRALTGVVWNHLGIGDPIKLEAWFKQLRRQRPKRKPAKKDRR